MSRKRKLKKQRKRQQEWIEQLEELYLRQADDAFLEAAEAHHKALDASPVADLHDEVVDRALAGALNAGDLARVGELLGRVRRVRRGAGRPLVLLAEAVDLLAKGRREAAAASLEALAEAGAAAPGVDPRLPGILRALAATGGGAAPPDAASATEPVWRKIEQTARLSRALEGHAVSGSGLPRSVELDSSSHRAVWSFYRALMAVAARDFRPGTKTLETLDRAVRAGRREAPADAALERLLAETARRLRALTALRQLEQTLRRRRGARAEELLLERLSATGISPELLRDDPPALLRPLHRALRSRWRALLERVSERRGAAGLAALLAARPETFAADLDSDAETAEIKKRIELAPLLESERFGELAALLRAAGARTESAHRLAALWSLELWAWHEEHESVVRPARSPADPHRRQQRLLEMATSLSSRFGAGERPEVARFLRDELLQLYDELYFCRHSLLAAEALMEHLGDDPGLLIVGLAGAACSEDERARRRLAARAAARGPARAGREALLRLVSAIVAEEPAVAVPVLTASQPLFDEAGWRAALDRVATDATAGMREGLEEASEMALDVPEEAEWIRNAVRRDLDLYRPLLGERLEIAALDVALDSHGATPEAARLQVRHFLSRFEGLEPALMLYHQARELSPEGSYARVDPAIAAAVFERLDSRWPLWAACVMHHLAFGDATKAQVRRLKQKIRGFLREEALDEDDRAALERIRRDAGKIRRIKRITRLAGVSWPDDAAQTPSRDAAMPEPEPADEPDSRPTKPRARSRRPVDDRQLDLFEPS